MKIYQFEIFITVARAKSLSKAASLLYLSQPAVSKHIKSMEEYYGTQLFERTNQGVKLTEAGEVVYDYARQLRELHDELEQEIDGFLNPEELNLDIGASPTPGEYLLPCTLWSFKEKHPSTNVELKVDYSNSIVESILQEKLLLGVVEGDLPASSSLACDLLMKDQLKIIAADNNEIEQLKNLNDIKDMPVILPSDDFYIRKKLTELLNEQDIPVQDLNVVAEMNSLTAIKSAVESGVGVSFLSYSSVKKPVFQNRIKILELAEEPPEKFELEINLTYSRELEHPGIITKFISFLTMQHEHSFC